MAKPPSIRQKRPRWMPFGSLAARGRSKSARRARTLLLEPLECRDLLAVDSADLIGQQLQIVLDSRDSLVRLQSFPVQDRLEVLNNGVLFRSFPQSQVASIRVAGNTGNDRLSIDSNLSERQATSPLPIEFTGGGGSDAIVQFGRPVNNTWRLTGRNAGTLNETIRFSSVGLLEGGAGYDMVHTGGFVMTGGFRDAGDLLDIRGDGDLRLEGSVTAKGNVRIETAGTFTLTGSRVIDTRHVTSGASRDAPSVANSGFVRIVAPHIRLEPFTQILTWADHGFQAGAIELESPPGAAEASIRLDGATIKGGSVRLINQTTNSDSFTDDSPHGNFALDALAEIGDSSPILGAGRIVDANSVIRLTGLTVIEAADLQILADAQATAAVSTIFTAIDIAYGESRPTARVELDPGTRIRTSNSTRIATTARSTVDVKAETVNLGSSIFNASVPIQITFAGGLSKSNSIIDVKPGVTIEAGENVTLDAKSHKSSSVQANAGAYEDGSVGVALAFSRSENTTQALLGGNILAGGDVSVFASADTPRNITSTASSVGNTFVVKAVVSAVNTVRKTIEKAANKMRDRTPQADPRSGTTRQFAVAASFSYADHVQRVTAAIAPQSVVDARQGAVVVLASATEIPQNAATSLIDTGKLGPPRPGGAPDPLGHTKENAFSTGLTLGYFTNHVDAFVGSRAAVRVGRGLFVVSSVRMPYEMGWNDIRGVGDIFSALNSGLKLGVINSWSQAAAQGTQLAVAGALNFLTITTTSRAHVDAGAQILPGEGVLPAEWPAVMVRAVTEVDTANLSGNFSFGQLQDILGMFKDSLYTVSPTAAGVGAAYLQVAYDTETTARIAEDVQLQASDLKVLAESRHRALALAESGGKAQSWAFNGSASFVRVVTRTHAHIAPGAAIRVDDGGKEPSSGVSVEAKDESRIFSGGGGIAKGGSVGAGFSVAVNDLTRDTQAIVGHDQPVAGAAPRGSIRSRGDVRVQATNTGHIGSYALAAAVAQPTAPQYQEPQVAPQQAGLFGFGISGEVGLNTVSDTTRAVIHDAQLELTDPQANLRLDARNNSRIESWGGAATMVLGSPSSIGLAGTWTQNTLTGQTTAEIGPSVITLAGSVYVRAATEMGIESRSLSGSGAPLSSSAAGSVAINDSNVATAVKLLEGAKLTGVQDVLLHAADNSSIQGFAGVGVLAGQMSFGTSVIDSTIRNWVSADIRNVRLVAKGVIALIADTHHNVHSRTQALGGAGSLSAVGSVSRNLLGGGTFTLVSGSSLQANDIYAGADNSSVLTSRAGGIQAGLATLGGSFSINTLRHLAGVVVVDSTLDTRKTASLNASARRNLEATASGGALSAGALTGSVVINDFQDTVDAHLLRSRVTAGGSFTVIAFADHRATVDGGVGTIGLLGIGGTGVSNRFRNLTQAYIGGDSQITAVGMQAIGIPDGTGVSSAVVVQGVAVVAEGGARLDVRTGNGVAAALGGLADTTSVNILENTVLAFIENSRVNELSAGAADPEQAVLIRAYAPTDVDVRAGGVAVGIAAGVGASHDTTILRNTTRAYLRDVSELRAQRLAEVQAAASQHVNTLAISGAISGSLSVAGSVAVIQVENQTESLIQNSTVASGKDVQVTADEVSRLGVLPDGTRRGVLAGSLAIGGAVGMDGSVVVTRLNSTVSAHILGSDVDAARRLRVAGRSTADIVTYAATAVLANYLGAGAAVSVNSIQGATLAYVASHGDRPTRINQDPSVHQPGEEVRIEATHDPRIEAHNGSATAALAVGVGSSIDVTSLQHRVDAFIGDATIVDAGSYISVTALGDRRYQSYVVAGGGGLLGVQGSVALVSIGSPISHDGKTAAANTEQAVNAHFAGQAFGNRLGTTEEAADAAVSADRARHRLSVSDELRPASLASALTRAFVGEARVTSGSLYVMSGDHNSVHARAGIGSLGAVAIGGGVAIVRAHSRAESFIASSAVITLGDELYLDASGRNLLTSDGYAGALGFVGLGAAWAEVEAGTSPRAELRPDVRLDAGGDVTISSRGYSNLTANAVGNAVGALAAGLVHARAVEEGTSAALIGDRVQISADIVDVTRTRNLAVRADHAPTVTAIAVAAQGGIVSGAGVRSDASATPIVRAAIGNDSVIQVGGSADISARVNGLASSWGWGVQVSGVSLGASFAYATWAPRAYTTLGDHAQLRAGGPIVIEASENHVGDERDTRTSVRADARSAQGNLVGALGSLARIWADSALLVDLGRQTLVEGHADVMLRARGNSTALSRANGFSFSIASFGTTSAELSGNNQVHVRTADSATVRGKNVSVLGRSHRSQQADAGGGQGGALTIGGTFTRNTLHDDRTSVELGSGNSLRADELLAVDASGETQLRSVASQFAAAGIAINEVEAHTRAEQSLVQTRLGNQSRLEGAVVSLTSHNSVQQETNAYSKTVAVGSDNHATATYVGLPRALTFIGRDSRILGRDRVAIGSQQLKTTSGVRADTEITAGVTGRLKSTAHNVLESASQIVADPGSKITTSDLYVYSDSPAPEGAYHNIADTRAQTLLKYVQKVVGTVCEVAITILTFGLAEEEEICRPVVEWVAVLTFSDETATRTGSHRRDTLIDFHADVTSVNKSQPELIIDAAGQVAAAKGVQFENRPDRIVVTGLGDGDKGRVEFWAPNAVLTGTAPITVDQSFSRATIRNHSHKLLELQHLDSWDSDFSKPDIRVAVRDRSQFRYPTRITTSQTNLDVANHGAADILLNGTIRNPDGNTAITNLGGELRSAGGHQLIETRVLNLSSVTGDVGQPNARVRAKLVAHQRQQPYLGGFAKGDYFAHLLSASRDGGSVQVRANEIRAGGRIDILIDDAVGEQMTVHGPQAYTFVPLAVSLDQVQAGGPVTVQAGGSTVIPVTMNVSSDRVDLTVTGDISLQAAAGDMLVGRIHSSRGDVQLTAAGALRQAAGVDQAGIAGNNVRLVAGTEVGAPHEYLLVDTASSSPGALTVTAADDVYIRETSGDLPLAGVKTAKNVYLNSPGKLLDASGPPPSATAPLSLTAQAAPPVLEAAEFVIQAGDAVGSVEKPLAVKLTRLEAVVEAGGLWLENSGPLTIGGVSGVVGLKVAGPLAISVSEGLTVRENVVAGGDLMMGTIDSPIHGREHLFVLPGVVLQSATGQVTLAAGDNLRLDPGSELRAAGPVTLLADALDADAGQGALISLQAIVLAPQVVIRGGPDADVVSLSRLDSPARVELGAGADRVRVGSRAVAGNQGGLLDPIAALLEVVGDTGHDQLEIDDSGSVAARQGTFTAHGLVGLGLGNNSPTSGIRYRDVELVQLGLGRGNDTLNVLSTAARTTVNVKLGAGTNRVNVGSVAPRQGGKVAGLAGRLTLAGDGVHDTLSVDDRGNNLSQRDGRLTASMLTGLGTAGVIFTGLEAIEVGLGSGNDLFTIAELDPRVAVRMDGGKGNDRLQAQFALDFSSQLTFAAFEDATLQVGRDFRGTVTAQSPGVRQVTIGRSLLEKSQLTAAAIDSFKTGLDVAGTVRTAGRLRSVEIQGSLAASGIIHAGSLDQAAVGGHLAGEVVVAGKLGDLSVQGATPGKITAGDIDTLSARRAGSGSVLQVSEAGILRRMEAIGQGAIVVPHAAAAGPGLSLVPATPPSAAVTLSYFYDSRRDAGIVDPQLAVRVDNPGEGRFDLALQSFHDFARFQLARLDTPAGSDGNRRAAGLRNLVVEGDLLTAVTAPMAAYFRDPAGAGGGVVLPADQLQGVSVRNLAPAGSIRVARIAGLAFGTTQDKKGRLLDSRKAGPEDAARILAAGVRIAPLAVGTPDPRFRVAFSRSQPVAHFLATEPDKSRFDKDRILFVDQGADLFQPIPVPDLRGAVIALVQMETGSASGEKSPRAVVRRIDLVGDGGAVESDAWISHGISSTGPLGDLTIHAREGLTDVQAPSILGSLRITHGPLTGTVETTGQRMDPVTGLHSQVSAQFGASGVRTGKDGPSPRVTTVEVDGPLTGRLVSRGDLVSQVIVRKDMTGVIAVQGNVVGTPTDVSGHKAPLGGIVLEDDLRGSIVVLGSVLADVTIDDKLEGRIAIRGDLLRSLHVDKKVEKEAVILVDGDLGRAAWGTGLDAQSVRGIVAAEGTIQTAKGLKTSEAAFFQGNLHDSTSSGKAIDAVFTELGVAMNLDHAGVALGGLDRMLRDLSRIRLDGQGNLAGPVV